MKDVFKHIDDNLDARVDKLFAWLRIPSVSSIPAYKDHCRSAAQWLVDTFTEIGLSRVELIETGGHPAVYGEWIGSAEWPTVLFYGHYDVQPAAKEDGWESDPFEPMKKFRRIWCRGVADDKGQVHAQLSAVESVLKVRAKLPCNVKFIVEGEEESGSEHTESLIEQNVELLSCNVAVISDSPMIADGYPSICVGLRGLAYGEVVVEGPTWDLHSGSFGGAVPNPANALAKMLSNLHDKDGKVAVPDFYADVVDLNRKQRSAFSQLPFDEKWFLQTAGVSATAGEKGYTTLERIWGRPTLDINGIISGFVGDGAKTIIPRRATAKLSARLVANQKPEKILARIEDYLKGLAPPGVRVTFNTLYTGEPYLADVSGAPYVAARKALKEGFGADPVEIREGGSIPIVGTFSKVLRAPTVLMGFGLPDQNAHGPNENLRIENYQKGTRAISEFLFEMAKIT